ncbi:DUF4232 domain-containing protein [Streptomyces thermogriseus]|uniref:DUF4232 domain-containing protein n=1 Tax=Streptomyces thermogriseus TaxID=75292 RepID=A0ABP4DIW2_9ACTN
MSALVRSKGWKSYAIGAAVIAALLGTTACGSSAANGSGEVKSSNQLNATSLAKLSETASGKPGNAPGSTSGDSNGGVSGGAGTIAACTQNGLAVSAVKEPADSKEARHLLIIVQNVGDEKCNLHHYPYVRLGNGQTTVPVIEDSDPDPGVPVTIAPGEEAYAALLVSGGARDEYEVKNITLTLQGRKPGSKVSKPIDVPMPVDTLYADDGQLVTYWTTASDFALDFIMSK